MVALKRTCVNKRLRCEDQILPLAIKYMDRFLGFFYIEKEQFQLVAAVALVMGTKIRLTDPLTSEIVSYYTAYSVSSDEIQVSQILWKFI